MDIVERLKAEPYWVGGSQQQSEGESSDVPFEAAAEIERLRTERDELIKAVAEARSRPDTLRADKAELERDEARAAVKTQNGVIIAGTMRVIAAERKVERLRGDAAFVRDTFKKDMEQGYTTKDKQFAVEILSLSLKETGPEGERRQQN